MRSKKKSVETPRNDMTMPVYDFIPAVIKIKLNLDDGSDN
jgi:hypothetical protein